MRGSPELLTSAIPANTDPKALPPSLCAENLRTLHTACGIPTSQARPTAPEENRINPYTSFG
jgi:hypothetical protein